MPFTARHSAPDIWESVLGQLLLRVTRQNFENWLRNTAGDHFDGTVLVVRTPNELSRDWLTSRMKTLVSQALITVAGQGLGVRFETAISERASECSDLPLQPALVREQSQAANPKFRFETFIAGSHNQMALNAALDVAGENDSPYSPLFITGQTGSGKTHLLHAIAHQAVACGARSLLVNADQFISDFTGAVRMRTGPAFRAQYRDVDFFLMDDAHVLIGKKASQAEFYQTVACLHDQGRRIVVAGDHSALMCEAASRFDTSLRWGLVACIDEPDMADRIRFLESRVHQHEISLEPAVLHYIALRVRSNVRELEGAINRVLAHARITAEPITIDFAAKALQPISPSTSFPTSSVQPSELVTSACRHFGITADVIQSARRDRPATYARHVVMYLLRKDAGMTYSAIAALLRKADHSTIVHACTQLEHELGVNATLRADLDAIRAAMRRSPSAA